MFVAEVSSPGAPCEKSRSTNRRFPHNGRIDYILIAADGGARCSELWSSAAAGSTAGHDSAAMLLSVTKHVVAINAVR